MRGISGAIAGLTMLALAAGPALASPVGVWDLETRDTRFQLGFCGDGTQLCGQLVWLSDADYNDKYKPYLGKPMANGMRQVAQGKWKGQLKLFGYTMNGTITERSNDHLTLSGCAFLVVCKTYEMYRYAE